MDTFLDTGLSKTRTFILYGNLKDTVWCGDLIPRDMEQYLVKLLKSRGYRHVIFYGGAGTKGAYCLDRESACFFFAENHSLPLPKPLILKGSRLKEDSDDPDEDEAENQESSQELKQKAGSAAKPSGGRVHSMMDRLRGGNRHVSGSLADDEDEDDGGGTAAAADAAEARKTETSKKSSGGRVHSMMNRSRKSGSYTPGSLVDDDDEDEDAGGGTAAAADAAEARKTTDTSKKSSGGRVHSMMNRSRKSGSHTPGGPVNDEDKDGDEENAMAVSADVAEVRTAPDTSKKPSGGRVHSMMGRSRKNARYTPGAISDDDDDEEEGTPQPADAESGPDPKAEPKPEPEPEKKPARPRRDQRIRYSFRSQVLSEFLQQVHQLMQKPDSHMAVVFYNALTTDLTSSDLKDDILDIWEKNGQGNVCLLLMPETMHNLSAVIRKVQESGLESKFLQQLGSCSEMIPNAYNCIRFGQPGPDEISNMLRYLAIVGTSRKNRAVLNYRTLPELAARIQYASGVRSSQSVLGSELASEYLRELYGRLTEYLDRGGVSKQRIPLSADVIDGIWGIHSEAGQAMEKLKRPGWEPAYNKVTEYLRIAEAQKKPRKEPVRTGPDWAVERIASVREDGTGPRPVIPNFVILGRPGTGKTTIARLIGEILRENGILKIGHTVEVKRESLTSSLVAGVPKATMAQVDKAEEGVLFIDEAHALGVRDGGVGHEGTGVEVVSTLNAVLTSPNHHLCVILAGYPEKMDAVFDLDPGFRRRFEDNFIRLEDYKPELLKTILLNILKENGVSVSPELTEPRQIHETVYTPLQCMVDRIYEERDRVNFGNAGEMEALARRAGGHLRDGQVVQESFYGGYNGKIQENWFTPQNVGSTMDQILKELDENFVGMKEAKDAIRRIGLQLQEFQARGIPADQFELEHLILAGNPGTGKSTLARLLPRLYYNFHVLGTSEPILVSASELASTYQGGTQEKVQEYIKDAQAKKGFLFVDEAHELLNERFDGRGAFKAFMAPTTDRAHPFLACFGVYYSQVDAFLRLDPGSASRFRIITLPDYTGEELFTILERMMKKQNLSASEDTRDLLRQVTDRIYATRTEHTGNARRMETLLREMNALRRERCMTTGIPFDAPESYVFQPEDIPESLRRNLTVRDKGSAVRRLQEMKEQIRNERTGNEELKEVLLRKTDSLIYNKQFARSNRILEPGHYFFKGNPGTGKTTGAEFFGRYLHALGLVASGEVRHVSATDLVAGYVGQTGHMTRELLESSVGKVLLIDEAYALSDPDQQGMSFKREAIAEVVRFLDDDTFRKTTCVIFAGYEHDMDGLYQVNEGMKSRITEVFFPDFTLEQSMAVMHSMVEKAGFTLGEGTELLCTLQMAQMLTSPDFANGRTVRRYVQVLIGCLEARCMENIGTYEPEDPRAYQILPEDIPELPSVFQSLNLRVPPGGFSDRSPGGEV